MTLDRVRADVLEELAGSRYLRLTTFRRDGQPVHTVVWHVVAEEILYVHTGDQTGKAKRLRANGRAEIAVSDGRGKTIGVPIVASGSTLNGQDPQRLDEAFRTKYGMQYRAVRLTEPIRRGKIGEPSFFQFTIDQVGSPQAEH